MNDTNYRHQECKRDHHSENTLWEYYEKFYAKKFDDLLDKKTPSKKNYRSQTKRKIISAYNDSIARPLNKTRC